MRVTRVPLRSLFLEAMLLLALLYITCTHYRYERAGAVFNVDKDMRSKYTDKSVK